MAINLLLIHIVSCRILQLKMWWLVTIHSERFFLKILSQLHAPHICPRVLRRITFITNEFIYHRILISVRFSVERIRLFLLHVPFKIYYRLQLIRHGGQFHLHYFSLVLMHDHRSFDHHHGLKWSSFFNPEGNDEGFMPFLFERVYTRKWRVALI